MAGMKLRCLICGAEMDLDRATQASELLALDSLAQRFGEDWPLVSEYLELFRRRPDGPLNVKVRIRLLYDLLAMWSGGKFEFNRQWYTVGRREFQEALSQVCSRDLKALSNHNYLKTVLTSAAAETSKRLEKEMKEREKGLRAGPEQGSGVRDQGLEERQPPADPEFVSLVIRSLDKNLTESERLEVKNKIREISQARSAQNLAGHPTWKPSPGQGEYRKGCAMIEENEELQIAEDLLKLVGQEVPSKEEIARVRQRLNDPAWRARVDKLGKDVIRARTPAEREAAEAALWAHLNRETNDSEA